MSEEQRQTAEGDRHLAAARKVLRSDFARRYLLDVARELAAAEARGEARGRAEVDRLRARVEELAAEHEEAADRAASEAARLLEAGQVPIGVVDYHQQQADKAYYIADLLRAVLADTEGGQA